MASKIDSNITGLRYAEEASLKTLPGSPIWYGLEPNSYKDFGATIKTVARNPINPTRQRKKGVVTDLDASGGFVQDLTLSNTARLLQGFMFADVREKKTTAPMNSAAVVITSTDSTSKEYRAAAGLNNFVPGALVLASGSAVPGNNGIKTVATSLAAALAVVETVTTEASPSANLKLETVGFKFGVGTVAIALNGSLVRMTSSTTDLTTLGLIVGEWLYLGGDAAGSGFVNNRGFARISVIAAGYLEFDKTDWTGATEAATGLTIQIFYGSVFRNEFDSALIKRRTYNIERTVGSDGSGTMSEYLEGSVANEMTLNIPQADKVTLDMSFIALDNAQRDGATGLKSGSRPTLPVDDAFNTSSDFSRIKLASVSTTDSAPTPLFAYTTDMSVDLKNNASPTKAIGVLGGFEVNVGTFEVGGKLTAYFSSIASVQAVRNNASITLDAVMVKSNKGFLFDIPLLTLGDGRLTVEQDKPIMIPLENMAAESAFGYTLLLQTFAYLPTAAG